MQPKGAEPLASAPLGTAHPIAPSRSWTATRSRHGHCVAAWPFDDGTSLRFMILRRSWVSRFPGEHSLSLGTPGLHDESPLGFATPHHNHTQMTKPITPTPIIALRPIHEPQRGSVMQPKGAEPLASAPLGTAHPITPSRSRTATRSRHVHCASAWPLG